MAEERTQLKIEQSYFVWLCKIVGLHKRKAQYYSLMDDLFSKGFRYTLPMDENRALDGLALREIFRADNHMSKSEILEGPCNVLEVLVALAQRMNFEMSDPDLDETDHTSWFFWEMIDNLGLTAYSDDMYYQNDGSFAVDVVLNTFLDRMYEPDGTGGLFPLNHPGEDQRYVEIWYQMNAYLIEKGAI